MILLLSLVLSSFAIAAEPKAVVEEVFAKASVAEVATDPAKQKEVTAHVDFNALASAALGGEKKKQPAKEYEWFRSTLEEILARTVFPKAPEFLAGVKIQYGKVEEKGAAATVKSTVQNKADITDVDYRLAKVGDAWKVTDVAISGISWVDSIRDQVRDVVKKKKWKGLKDAMNKRLADLKAGKQ